MNKKTKLQEFNALDTIHQARLFLELFCSAYPPEYNFSLCLIRQMEKPQFKALRSEVRKRRPETAKRMTWTRNRLEKAARSVEQARYICETSWGRHG